MHLLCKRNVRGQYGCPFTMTKVAETGTEQRVDAMRGESSRQEALQAHMSF